MYMRTACLTHDTQMLAGSRLQLTAVHPTTAPSAAADEPLARVPIAAGRSAGDTEEEVSSAAALPAAYRMSAPSIVAINAASGQPRWAASIPVTGTLVAMGADVPQRLPTPAPMPHGQRMSAAGMLPSASADGSADSTRAQEPAPDEVDETDSSNGDTSTPDADVPMKPAATAALSQATPALCSKKRNHCLSDLVDHGEAIMFQASVCCSYLGLTRCQRAPAAYLAYLAAWTMTRMTSRQRQTGSMTTTRQAASTAR